MGYRSEICAGVPIEDKDKALFLSLIAPNEWDRPYIGSFKLQTDGKWEKTSQE